MKNYLNLILIVLFAVLLISVSALISKTIEQGKEIDRKTSNIVALNSNLETYRNFANQSVAKTRALTYTNAEYRTFKAQDTQTIKELKIRLKNALNTTNIETQTITEFKTKLIYTPKDTCFVYKDEFYDVNGCIINDSVAQNIKSKEKLFLVLHSEFTKHFWFIRYGRKVTNITAKTANPNSSITALEFVELKKK